MASDSPGRPPSRGASHRASARTAYLAVRGPCRRVSARRPRYRERGHCGWPAARPPRPARRLPRSRGCRAVERALERRERALAAAREALVHIDCALEQETRDRGPVVLTRLANPHARNILTRPRGLYRWTRDGPLHRPAGPALPGAQLVDPVRLPARAVRPRAVPRARSDARAQRDHQRRRLHRARKGPRRRSREIDTTRSSSRARRGHPHGDRAAADGDRRPGRRQAAHRTLAERPGGHRRRHARPRAQPGGEGLLPAHGHARLGRRAPHGLAAARVHAHAARPAGLSLPPPARLLLEVPARPFSASTSASTRNGTFRSAPARSPA